VANTVTEKEFKKLEAIARLNHSIGSTLELQQISRISIREITDIVQCDGCAIMLLERNEAKILAERGLSKTFKKLKFNTDIPAINYIVNKKRSIFSNDVASNADIACIPYVCHMNSLICTPIIIDSEVKGIIHLDSIKTNAFDEQDLGFTELLAREISIAAERSLQYSRVLDISVRDALTGCYNRGKFDADFGIEMDAARRKRKPLSLLMIDIDWFKKYNDFHGHPMGDVAIRKVVDILTSHVRPLDGVYRYGGEEFAVMLRNTPKEYALLVAKRLQSAVEREPFDGEQESQPNKKLTISIGVAVFPENINRSNKPVEVADLALYQAKRYGGNQVCCFSDDPCPEWQYPGHTAVNN